MKRPLLYETLKVLFRYPIIILMLGDWRTGKTDTSLLVAHLAKKWKLIDKIGSNIYTFNDPEVDHIITLGKLKKWLHADRLIKLFIFDEGLKHVYRRKAMSQKNVDIITEVLPELSKGHGRMIFCSQIEKLDSDILHPAFTRAIWKKKSKKVMECRSKHHPPRTFKNLPRSPIRFDPDRLAPFIDKDMSKEGENRNMGLTYEIAVMYASGVSMTQIKTQKDVHQEQVKREIRKALKWFVKEFPESNEGKEAEIVNNPE